MIISLIIFMWFVNDPSAIFRDRKYADRRISAEFGEDGLSLSLIIVKLFTNNQKMSIIKV